MMTNETTQTKLVCYQKCVWLDVETHPKIFSWSVTCRPTKGIAEIHCEFSSCTVQITYCCIFRVGWTCDINCELIFNFDSGILIPFSCLQPLEKHFSLVVDPRSVTLCGDTVMKTGEIMHCLDWCHGSVWHCFVMISGVIISDVYWIAKCCIKLFLGL